MPRKHPQSRRPCLLAAASVALIAVLGAAVPAAGAAQTKPNGAKVAGARLDCRLGPGVRPPCLRARNIREGLAFVFATGGRLGGLLRVGRGGDDAKPFTTNATGVATGLNADRVDGRNASDFLLAGGKAADSQTLDGLDSSAFARAGAPAGDADTVDGMHASDFLAASRLVSLGGDPRIDAGDPVSTIGAGNGLTFKASCAPGPGGTSVTVLMSVDSGAARFGFAEPATVGSDQVDVSSADGDVDVLVTDDGTIGSDMVTPVQVAVARDDGTTLTGTIAVGVGFGPSDCFVSGSLMG